MIKELGLVVAGFAIGVGVTVYVTKDFLMEGFAHKLAYVIDEEVQDMKDEMYNEQVKKDNQRDYTKPLRKSGNKPLRKSGKYPWGEGGIKIATNRIMVDREKATEVLDALIEHINLYGFVALADYNDFTDVESSYEDSMYGWTNLNGAVVIPKLEGFTIKLPAAKILNK